MPAILVVDDNPLIRWSLEVVLSREGYEVSGLDSAEKALAAVETCRFDAAIVDVVLPGMDGLQLIGCLQSVCPDIKILVITGRGSRDVEQSALEQGSYAYVEKPFSVSELVGLVKTVLPSPDIG